MTKMITTMLMGLIIATLSNLQAETTGKLDVAPTFMHIDILESGRTVKRMDMWGVRADAAYFLYKGLHVKPVIMYGNGSSAEGGLFAGSVALGYCLPVHEKVLFSPAVGVNYSHLWTKIDVPMLQLKNLRENFRSWAPFISMDMHYTFVPTWRVCLGVQYAWSHTKTSIEKLVKNQKSSPEGFVYSCMIEHDVNDQWSVNLGAAYNVSLTHEKHGLRAAGVKAGVVRWF